MVRTLVATALLWLLPFSAAAQVADGFEDGNFSAAPVWSGEAAHWRVIDRDGSRWLSTSGLPQSDTLYLATPSRVGYGTWHFRFAHDAVNLSNANGVRVYLVADRADLRGPVRGYFLQMGTTNADEVRLYRQDGAAENAANRVEIGRSEPLLAGDDGYYEIVVERSEGGHWTVRMGGQEVLTASDDTYASGTSFGFWVKHSSTASQSYFFDDVAVNGTAGPPDTTEPRITTDGYDEALPGFVIEFSEPLDAATLAPQDFQLSNGGVVTPYLLSDAARLQLQLGEPLESGTYQLAVTGLADLSGNALRDTTLTYVITRDTDPPGLVSLATSAPDQIFVHFSEAVVNACTPSAYTLAPADALISGISCEAGTATDTLTLFLSAALQPGTSYTLTAHSIQDRVGNTQSVSGIFQMPDVPVPGDVVINEILYAPPSGVPEYVELLNVSSKTLDLSRFTLADDTGTPRVLTDAPSLLAPGAYAVVTRDQAAFAAVFPGVTALQPAAWPALNNSGDAVVLKAGDVPVDSLTYGAEWGSMGLSLERIDPESPADHAANWAATTDPLGGTPGRQNSRYAPDLVAPQVLRVEEIATDRLDVTFSEAVDPRSIVASAFTLDAGSTNSAALVGSREVSLTLAEGSAPTSVMVGGIRDLKGNVMADTTLAIAFRPKRGEIVINEILFVPLADPADERPDQPEYVELLNRSAHVLSLRDLTIAGAADETGVADSLHLPSDLPALPPGGFIIVYDADDQDGDPAIASRLARAFPSIELSAPGIVLVPVPTVTRNGLANSGERLHLIAAGVSLDDVRYASDWQDAALLTSTGIALERIDAEVASNDPRNWASSAAAAGGTPGAVNTVSPIPEARSPLPGDLGINEVMYQPIADARDTRPDQTEYVELLNRSDDLLDLNGLLLLDTPDESGDADTLRLAFRPTPLPPGGYAVLYRLSGMYGAAETPSELLEQAFPGSITGLLLPQRAAGFSLPDAGRTLRLISTNGDLLEEVAYSPRWHIGSLRDPAGIALERISVDAPADEPTNWSSSPDPSGGTPGTRNGVTLNPGDSDLPANVGVTITPPTFSPDGDGNDDHARIQYRLNRPASSLRVRLFDQRGRLVRTLTQAQTAGPVGQLLWDGRDDDGRSLRIGIYIVVLEALDVGAGVAESFRAPVVLARPL